MKNYQLSREADADLDRIWAYIAQRASAEAASDFIWKFYETFRSIAASPRAGVNMPELPGNVRKFPMGNYLIYYRVVPGKILIDRVLHGKRLQRRAFLKKPTR